MMADILRLLRDWPLHGEPRVTPVTPGFSGARVYRVQAGRETFALRQWPADSLPAARIRELHRFLTDLWRRGIDFLSVPVADARGASLRRHRGRWWQLEPWLPGRAVGDPPGDKQLQAAMRSLAAVHRAAEEYEATDSGRTWFFQQRAAPAPAVVERLRQVRECDPAQLQWRLTQRAAAPQTSIGADIQDWLRDYVLAAPVIERELANLAETEFRLHPCLRDVHREHVLFSEDAVTGIIDASAARSENVASDLSRLLGSLLGDDQDRWEFALNAYSTARPLSRDERRLVRALDRSGVLLSGLTWVQRLMHRSDIADDPRIRSRFETLASRLHHLTPRLHPGSTGN